MAWGWGWGQPNRYGYYGLNCKMRPKGSGTTHSNRREQRKALQWEYLEQQDPEENLEEHLKALEKAKERAQQRLEEVKKKKMEEEEEYSYYSYSSSSQDSKRSRSRAPSKKATLEKVAPAKKATLEKVAPAKKATLEKAAPAKQATLEKVDLRRTRRAKDGTTEKLLEAKEDEKPAASSKEATPSKSLEKDTKRGKSLEKDSAKSKQDVNKEKSLEKDNGSSSQDASKPLEKGTGPVVVLKPAASKRPILVVDWHNTLEVNNKIPPENLVALEKVTQVADVHILSYVATWTREQAVKRDTSALIPFKIWDRLMGVHTCWEKVGRDGKFEWCKWLDADAIMDDDNDIIHECKDMSLMECYAICGPKGQHHNLPSKMVVKTFAEAVEAFLEDFDL